MPDHAYDVFVYHDFSSDEIPELGKSFPGFPETFKVVTIAPGVNEGRTTVVLAFGDRPAPEIVERFSRSG